MNATVKPPAMAAELPMPEAIKPAPDIAAIEALIAKAIKPNEPEPDFWDDLSGAYEVIEQPRTCVYWTASNHVGIRQQTDDPAFDRDVVALIVPENAEGVAHAILAIARDIIKARKR